MRGIDPYTYRVKFNKKPRDDPKRVDRGCEFGCKTLIYLGLSPFPV